MGSFSSELLQLLLSLAMATAMAVAMEVMAMEAIVVDTVDIEATMARGLLMLPLMPLLMLSLGTMATVDMVLDMDMVATDSEDTMARGRLMPRLSPDMATDTDVDTDMVAMDVSMEAMEDTAEDTTARGRPRLSPDMATDTDVDTDMEAMVMAVPMEDMGMEEDTMDKFHPITSFHTATFILVLKLSLVLLQNFLK